MGAGLGLDAGCVEVLHGACFDCGEGFFEFDAVIALAGGLCGETAEQRAGALEDVGGQDDGLGCDSANGLNVGIDQGEVLVGVFDKQDGCGGIE